MVLLGVLYGVLMVYVVAPHDAGRGRDKDAQALDGTWGFSDMDWMDSGAYIPREMGRKESIKQEPLMQPDPPPATPAAKLPAPELPGAVGGSINRPGCEDTNAECAAWAAGGECQANPAFMAHGCKASCGLCRAAKVTEAVTLHSAGSSMPAVGFGTAGLGAATTQAVTWAYQAGYRHFDSAQAREWYREDLVGEALRSPLENLREELFITSKLHPRDLGYNRTTQRVAASLEDLHTDYLDLFLLHYPRCWPGICAGEPEGTWRDSWRALEDLWKRGVFKAIGVSNFNAEELAELVKFARIKPHVVQANSDPFNPNEDLQDACRLHGIQFVAYSSLGSQWLMRGYAENPVLSSPTVRSIAERLGGGVSEAQVVLRWALQEGQVVIPRSSKQARIEQNRDLFGFELSRDDVEQIRRMAGKLPPKDTKGRMR